MSAPAEVLLEVRDLTVDIATESGTLHAVQGIGFDVRRGETFCLVGESGCGKSLTALAVMGLLPRRAVRTATAMRLETTDLLAQSERALENLRGRRMAMIFQEPMTALDPVYRIGDQIAETVIRHEGISRQAAMARALELLQLVKVPSPERRLRAYPHELSGGLRQRAMMAVALSCRPSLLLADEPTTALDATVQIQVLIMLRRLQQEFGMGMIFVTHDLGVAAQIADKVAVMYAGRIIEYGDVGDVLLRPAHPYTLGLLSSTVHGQSRDTEIEAIPGSPPDLRALPPGCSFAPRCRFAIAACTREFPPSATVGDGHTASCLRVDAVRQAALVHEVA